MIIGVDGHGLAWRGRSLTLFVSEVMAASNGRVW